MAFPTRILGADLLVPEPNWSDRTPCFAASVVGDIFAVASALMEENLAQLPGLSGLVEPQSHFRFYGFLKLPAKRKIVCIATCI